jgi:hypothetical protein
LVWTQAYFLSPMKLQSDGRRFKNGSLEWFYFPLLLIVHLMK